MPRLDGPGQGRQHVVRVGTLCLGIDVDVLNPRFVKLGVQF